MMQSRSCSRDRGARCVCAARAGQARFATVPYAGLPRGGSSTPAFESVESQHYPLNDLAGDFTRVGDVHAGAGVTARTGSGIKIAVADSGIDLTHADFPTPVEQFDVTDGVGISNWGTNVANTVSDHGTHVTGSALGRGTLSGGRYVGSAPAAELYFYKIGNDTTAGASEADEIEAIDRALRGLRHLHDELRRRGRLPGRFRRGQPESTLLWPPDDLFCRRGNDQTKGWHDSVTAPLSSTTSSFGFTVDNTAGVSTLNSPISVRLSGSTRARRQQHRPELHQPCGRKPDAGLQQFQRAARRASATF